MRPLLAMFLRNHLIPLSVVFYHDGSSLDETSSDGFTRDLLIRMAPATAHRSAIALLSLSTDRFKNPDLRSSMALAR